MMAPYQHQGVRGSSLWALSFVTWRPENRRAFLWGPSDRALFFVVIDSKTSWRPAFGEERLGERVGRTGN